MQVETRRAAPASSPALARDAPPPPFPEGWYFVATVPALEKARLIRKTWMGEEIVAWRDGEGNSCVAGAVCPHLGSDLGPGAGGRVRDGRLVCPFHGFEYDTTGQCVATPYADPPRAARLRVFPARELSGLVFAWYGAGGRPPQWSLPDDPHDDGAWTRQRVRTTRFAAHPQDTAENAVDMAHLRYVHGYYDVERVGELEVDGAYLLSCFNFSRRRKIAGIANATLHVSARTHIYGLGYSYVEIREHTIGFDARMWILATPVDGEVIDFTMASQAREVRSPKRFLMGLRFLPTRMRAPLLNKYTADGQDADVRQDEAIWSRKSYRPLPRLSRSDGEIMPFRAYCAQFYPDLGDCADGEAR